MYQMGFLFLAIHVAISHSKSLSLPWDFSPFQNWRWIPQLPRKNVFTRRSKAPRRTWVPSLGHDFWSPPGKRRSHGLRFTWPKKIIQNSGLQKVSKMLIHESILSSKHKKRIIKTENDDVVFAFKIWKQRMIKYPKWPLGWYHLISGFPTRFSKLGSANL